MQSKIAMRVVGRALVLSAFMVCAYGYAYAAQPPWLTIISPPSGTVVAPGDSITVEVQSLSDASFQTIAILGKGVQGLVQTGGPLYQIPVTIDNSAPVGPTKIRAASSAATSGFVQSTPISLVVQKSAAVTNLTAQPSKLHYDLVNGKKDPTEITAAFADGTEQGIRDAATYTTDNADVARVDAEGFVTPTGPGTTKIHASYLSATVDIAVTVSQFSPGDVNGDAFVDQDDLAMITVALNTPALGKNDPRDLNHDGKIDALDARLLVGLCSKPRCLRK